MTVRMHNRLVLPWLGFLALLVAGCSEYAVRGPQIPFLTPVASNGLAKTPPMGWNSWQKFGTGIDDPTIRSIADAMVTTGMRDAGYVYVDVEDGWTNGRDGDGNIEGNAKFPDMKGLADYVHSKGLKFGIYSSPGPYTCAGYMGSYGHELQDAKTFAAWGVDYLKYDWCSAGSVYGDDDSAYRAAYERMGDALVMAGRPVVYSLCEYGRDSPQVWASLVGGNLWRTTGDINDAWASMTGIIELQAPLAKYAGPGRWNDPDALEIGNGNMTDDEYRTQMSLWALTAAPLLAGNDIRTMSAATSSILMNQEVIAVDQDPLGRQAAPVTNGYLQTWIKPLADGSVAVGVVNLGKTAAPASIDARDLHLDGPVKTARDLWAHAGVVFTGGRYSATVPSHATILLRVSST
jgi:alpha-galactosidase